MGSDRHLLELWDRFINVQVCLETIINMNNKTCFLVIISLLFIRAIGRSLPVYIQFK